MYTKSWFKLVEKKISQHPILCTVSVLVVCGLILYFRKSSAFTQPQFWAEDGFIWFQDAYNQGFWHSILLPYAGTFSVINRSIAYCVSLLPLGVAPLLFNIVALLAQLLPVFLINSSRLLPIYKYRTLGILVSLIYVAVPNSNEVFMNLANVQWHLGITAFLILISTLPASRGWRIFDTVGLVVIGLNGPFSILLTVLAFLIWVRAKNRSSLINLSILVATGLLQLVSLFMIDPGQRGGHQIYSLTNAFKMLVGQIFTGGILGENRVNLFYGHITLYIALVVGFAIVAYAVIKGPTWLRYANLYSLLIFVSALASLKPLQGVDVWADLTKKGFGQRYWYISIIVWLATIIWITFSSKDRVLKSVGMLLLLLFLTIGLPESFKIKPLPNLNYSYYVKHFNASPSSTIITIPINPAGWQMTLIRH